MDINTLASARTRCSHHDNWRDDSTRCTITSDDGLPYYDPRDGRRYCKQHGLIERNVKLQKLQEKEQV